MENKELEKAKQPYEDIRENLKKEKFEMNEVVKQALENVKNIKVGCMVLNDLFGEELCIIEEALNNYEEDKKELIAEQHRLFDLAKEQETELNELREFAKIVATKGVDSLQAKSCKDDYDYNNWIDFMEYTILSKREFAIAKKVVEKYGKM